MSVSSSSLSPSGCIATGSQTVSRVNNTTISYFFYKGIPVWFKFMPVLLFFYFSAALWSLSDNSSFSSFQLLIFRKWHISLSLGTKKASQRHSLLFVRKLNNRCPVSNHQNFERSPATGHWSWCAAVIYIVICGQKSCSEVFPLCTCSQLIYSGSGNELCTQKTGVIWLNCAHWNPCILGARKGRTACAPKTFSM